MKIIKERSWFELLSGLASLIGIVGLIAGGVLAKTGLLAKVGIILLKFAKPLLAGVAAIGAWVMRFFKGRKDGDS